MSLPPQDVLDGINELIAEITGFKESDENFTICQRYCLSHVIHHTYPFVNRTTIKNLFQNYVSRFHGHGYFKVSQALNQQVKSFLGNTNLFEKNPQYDIQWCLLSLVSTLSTNLTAVKDVPVLLPTDDEEIEVDDIDWHEYLTQDLPKFVYSDDLSVEYDTPSSESEIEESEEDLQENANIHNDDGKENTDYEEPNALGAMCQNSCLITKKEELELNRQDCENEKASLLRKKRIQQLLHVRSLVGDIEYDYRTRGNISEKFDKLLNNIGFTRKSQILSELELMEYILYQFQTGEKILLKKGLVHPALTSVTEKTLSNYLNSLQPYFQIIRCFKDFDAEIIEAKYPDLCSSQVMNLSSTLTTVSPPTASHSQFKRRKIPNVLYVYGVMLRKALDPFQNEILSIADDLGSYTLIQMQQAIQPYFFELTSLFQVHSNATKNWNSDRNWLCSIRILSVLHQAIMNATTMKMSFLYLNMFLNCFQVYLDMIDSWISFLNLNDPLDEFIVTKSQTSCTPDSFFAELEVRPYKKELKDSDIDDAPILDFIAEKLIHVGQSLEVLKRMGRYVPEKSKMSSYQKLIESINNKISKLGTPLTPPRPQVKPQEKKRSIFTMSNMALGLTRDNGMGDSSLIGRVLDELKEETTKTAFEAEDSKGTRDSDSSRNRCFDLVYSTIKNPFFKQAFENVGVEYQLKRLEEARARSSDFELEVVKPPTEQKFVVYPYRKIIYESCKQIVGHRLSSACDLVKNIVLSECNFSGHLTFLRSVLLFNDSYLIQPFILTLFTQPVVWDNSGSLTTHLKECLEANYEDRASLLSVTVAKNLKMEEKNLLTAVDDMTINYEVNWPLTLLFTPNVMAKYNKIFRLAMKLKWAHWILSNLHFQNSSNSSLLKSTHHRLQLLRFWFLSTLGLINNYFVAQLNPSDLDFGSCDDFKDIINVHSHFIDKICKNCLLSEEKSSYLWLLVFQALIPLCVDLERCWREGNVVPKTTLKSMEANFSNCQVQISRILSSLVGK